MINRIPDILHKPPSFVNVLKQNLAFLIVWISLKLISIGDTKTLLIGELLRMLKGEHYIYHRSRIAHRCKAGSSESFPFALNQYFSLQDEFKK